MDKQPLTLSARRQQASYSLRCPSNSSALQCDEWPLGTLTPILLLLRVKLQTQACSVELTPHPLITLHYDRQHPALMSRPFGPASDTWLIFLGPWPLNNLAIKGPEAPAAQWRWKALSGTASLFSTGTARYLLPTGSAILPASLG